MTVVVLFGSTGCGKNYVGKIFEEFGFYFYDTDDDHSKKMRSLIKAGKIVPKMMREEYFEKVIIKTKQLEKKYRNVVIAQMFRKEKDRKRFLQEMPHAQFILVKTNLKTIENRVRKREGHIVSFEYWKKLHKMFDEPRIKYKTIKNSNKQDIRKQVKKLKLSPSP